MMMYKGLKTEKALVYGIILRGSTARGAQRADVYFDCYGLQEASAAPGSSFIFKFVYAIKEPTWMNVTYHFTGKKYIVNNMEVIK